MNKRRWLKAVLSWFQTHYSVFCSVTLSLGLFLLPRQSPVAMEAQEETAEPEEGAGRKEWMPPLLTAA